MLMISMVNLIKPVAAEFPFLSCSTFSGRRTDVRTGLLNIILKTSVDIGEQKLFMFP